MEGTADLNCAIMKVLLILCATLRIALSQTCSDKALNKAFNKWILDFNKIDSCEYDERFFNFERNKARIDDHNRKHNHDCSITYKLGLWDRSDLTEVEVNKFYNGLIVNLTETVEPRDIWLGSLHIVTANETNFDWRTKGVVTEIQDQRDCACCYAMSSTGALEAQIKLTSQNLTKLSDQQIIDCSFDYGNSGCGGGNTGNTFEYIQQNGIATDLSYPFEAAETGNCSYNQTCQAATIVDYRYIRIASNNFLRVKLVFKFYFNSLFIIFSPKDLVFSYGPVTVGMNASLFTFQSYSSGVYNDPECLGEMNHAMLLVGFGTDNQTGMDYWLLKNTYGTSWGENGYIKMTRQVPNFCGLWNYVTFPLLTL